MSDPQEHARTRSGARRMAAVAGAVTAVVAGSLGLAGPAAAAAPSVTVSPSSGLTDGQNVTVKGSGFTPNYANMVVVECAASATGANGCDTNDVKFTKADANGAFTVTLTVRSKFGSTDCTKVACLVRGHEGFKATSGKTGTSSALHFGAAATSSSPAPTHSPAPSSGGTGGSAAAGGSTSSTVGGAGVGAQSTAAAPSVEPTGANTGTAALRSTPVLSEVAGALALLLLLTAAVVYRRRNGGHPSA